jgi:S1-C subfamily serine protease
MKKLTIAFALILIGAFKLSAQPFSTQSQWESYFKNNIQNLDPIEGIWNNSNTTKQFVGNNLVRTDHNPQTATYAIYKVADRFITYLLGESSNLEMSFKNTASDNVYLMENTYNASKSTAKANAILTGIGLLEFSYEYPTEELKYQLKRQGIQWSDALRLTFEHQWIKISPRKADYERKQPTQPSSGTGFSISSNGIIVTNNHVIDGAKSIKIRGINSDFSKVYNGKILVSDKNNDLALLQIYDPSFTSFGVIPYTIKTNLSGVGENIFVLGYPLRATMGDEIKLTNGIISSKTGFQGDISSYQISAPVQPGNSGGPLFDSQGNLIGIVNAKHLGAENASYAVKSWYLRSLIELLSTPLNLPTSNSLNNKSLPEQVDIIKKFVYIIEIE